MKLNKNFEHQNLLVGDHINVPKGDATWFHEDAEETFLFGTHSDFLLCVSSFSCTWFASFVIKLSS